MGGGPLHRLVVLVALCASLLVCAPALAQGPAPGTPEYTARDAQNIVDAYGRQLAPGGQVANPAYLPSLIAEGTEVGLGQLARQVARPNRPAITAGNVFPGWNVGNPLRRGWNGHRGQTVAVTWTNRYGAQIRGTVFAPLPGARDPYTGRLLQGPFPGVVITTGSVQGSERMYHWLAEDLAERGYVVLTYDVQGQGTSETLPHQNEQVNALPFCNPVAPPGDKESFGCPGAPAQQASNFIFGTQDALSFFLSTPDKPYPNPNGSDVDDANPFNPLWQLFDHSPDPRPTAPGRDSRVAIVGHSLGAFAVSYVQGVDDRVQAAVALDKLSGDPQSAAGQLKEPVTPVVPSLAVQSEYGFTVSPYFTNQGSSLVPAPGEPSKAPDPRREQKTGFDAWRKAGVDTMLVVPRASTHLEYTDIPYVLPASRYGQGLTSVYVQGWLDRYLKHESAAPLSATRLRYLEPTAPGVFRPVELDRNRNLSFYFCSGQAFGSTRSDDLNGAGCR